MKKILVTGGAGYIGSFICRALKSNAYEPFVLDNLSSGHKDAIKGFEFEKIDFVTEKDKVEKLFEKEKFDGVIHMAAYIKMRESFVNPGKYFTNSLICTITVLDVMVKQKCV